MDRARVDVPALPPLRVARLSSLLAREAGGARFSFVGIVSRVEGVTTEPASLRTGCALAAWSPVRDM